MKTPRILTTGATVTALVMALSLSACSQSAIDDPAPSTPPLINSPSIPPTPDAGLPVSAAPSLASEDPAKVALALETATVMTTWAPATDYNRTDAELRARHLMTPERANEVIAPERPATGTEWLTAAEKNATSQPTVKLHAAHHEQNSIAVEASWQWVTDTGETWAGEEKHLFFFTFTDTEPYKIRDYTSFAQ